MPTVNTGSYRITVRVSPDTHGHLEVSATPLSAPAPQALRLVDAAVVERVVLEGKTVQLRLDRTDAMILSDLLEQVAYQLPEE